jgi:hypothetical protein
MNVPLIGLIRERLMDELVGERRGRGRVEAGQEGMEGWMTIWWGKAV